MRADVLTCSPTATALALDDFPDRTLFFRTAPSDSLQASAIAAEAERTGAVTAAVMYLDDGYGRPLAEATITALEGRGIEVPDAGIGFNADDDSLLDEATTIEADDPGVIVVLGDAEHGVRMLSNLADVSGVVPGAYQPTIIVNDALRRPPSAQDIIDLAPEIRDRIIGLSPSATSEVAGDGSPFAANARDCLVLIALAATRASSDAPDEMASFLSDVSDGGVSCRDFAECVALVTAGRNVDYGAVGGDVEIGSTGDPTSYRFERWRFDDQGVDVPITAPSAPLLPPS
jgi:branched-chain amino acid transport system substrate-binding protein